MAGRLLVLALLSAVIVVSGVIAGTEAVFSLNNAGGEPTFIENSSGMGLQASEQFLPVDSGHLAGESGIVTEAGGDDTGLEVVDFDSEVDDGDYGGFEREERRLQETEKAISAKYYVQYVALNKLLKVGPFKSGGANRRLPPRVRKGKGNRPAKKGKGTPESRLRAAIRFANRNPGLAVAFTLGRDVKLTAQLPLLVGTLNVEGSCRTRSGAVRACIIDGQARFPIFLASLRATPCTLTLRNLVLQNAKGGAYTGDPSTNTPASCDLVARGVTFRNNMNVAGGAIAMLGVYNIQGCIFENNAAEGDGGAILAGDAVGFYFAAALGSYVAADGFIATSTFRNNRAGVKPSMFNVGYGGALAHFGGPTLKIRSSTFDSNKALSSGTNGGAIHFRAGDNITVVRTAFRGNSAPIGGAVYAAPLLQFNQWGAPVGPNIWGTVKFCRCNFASNVASVKFADVAVNSTYAFDQGTVKALFCPGAPPGFGSLNPAKVTLVSKTDSCKACYRV
eukprot:TRINITY_DN2_c0_g1_i1.p1 TRINITY_DN2_c0_g1~~TRINITY_DN2_c0_g1_i1.p1  ORF type:complete len:550 (-),score=76.87 TRINITY_DN2_c0_g1_i1:829-2343(-)